MKIFCETCLDYVSVRVENEVKTKLIKGIEIKYNGKESYCSECESLVHSPEVRDYNLTELDRKYREIQNIVKIETIHQILETYNIGKRPLADLLGWGGQTISRYIDGDTPSKEYSDILIRIAGDPIYFSERLELGKNRIAEVAYKKAKAAIDAIVANNQKDASKIDQVISYLLSKCNDITPLALQKLLYYSQSFNKLFNNAFLFPNDCEAWVHGPVYRNVYEKFRHYQYNPIVIHSEVLVQLESYEKELLDCIVQNFGCYSGGILEKMTHLEQPWRETRIGLTENEASNRIIDKTLIEEYFSKVYSKYGMMNVGDIRDYSIDLFNKIH